MKIDVKEGDALSVTVDVLILKHAQQLYGVDEHVVARLEADGQPISETLPEPGDFRLVDTSHHVGPRSVLFVGVGPLREFGYGAIREFAREALTVLARVMPAASHVALTLHGPGYGLDEAEAFRAELAGILDAIRTGTHPAKLTSVTFIEVNQSRAQRLKCSKGSFNQPEVTCIEVNSLTSQFTLSQSKQPAIDQIRSRTSLLRCLLRPSSTTTTTTASRMPCTLPDFYASVLISQLSRAMCSRGSNDASTVHVY